MSSGDRECRPPLDSPGARLLWCLALELVIRFPDLRGLATSAMDPLVSGGVVSPSSSSAPSCSASRADRRKFDSEFLGVARREDDLTPLLEVLRAGLEFLPRPRSWPLCIRRRINLNSLSKVSRELAGQCSACAAACRYAGMKRENKAIGKRESEMRNNREVRVCTAYAALMYPVHLSS